MRDTREPLTEKYVHLSRNLSLHNVVGTPTPCSGIISSNSSRKIFLVLPLLVEQPAMSNCITLLYVYYVLGGDDKVVLLVLLARKLQTKLFPYRN